MNEHTPGPWEKVCRLDHTGEPELFVRTADGRDKQIVRWDTPYPDNADCANAELISRAPTLLEDINRLCRLLDRCRWELQWAADNNQLRQAVVLALVEYDRREEDQ